MKASELIEALQELIAEHGDREITEAENELIEAGHKPVSPLKNGLDSKSTWSDHIEDNIAPIILYIFWILIGAIMIYSADLDYEIFDADKPRTYREGFNLINKTSVSLLLIGFGVLLILSRSVLLCELMKKKNF
jgi:hypothetical protein